MVPFKYLKDWLWMLFLCGGLNVSVIADSPIILTVDHEYYNPFSFSLKFDLKFCNNDNSCVWNLTYEIVDNRTGKITSSQIFHNASFNGSGELYFFIRNQANDYEYLVCLIGRESFQSGTTVGGRRLKRHWLHLPSEIIIEPGKKQLLFTIKPYSQESIVRRCKGYNDIYLGLYSGTNDIDWSFFIEFNKVTVKSEKSNGNLAKEINVKKTVVFQTQKDLEKYVEEAKEKYKNGSINIDELNQAQNLLNKFIEQNRKTNYVDK